MRDSSPAFSLGWGFGLVDIAVGVRLLFLRRGITAFITVEGREVIVVVRVVAVSLRVPGIFCVVRILLCLGVDRDPFSTFGLWGL